MVWLSLVACSVPSVDPIDFDRILGPDDEPPILLIHDLLTTSQWELSFSSLSCSMIDDFEFACRTVLPHCHLAAIIERRGLSVGEPADLRVREPDRGCPVTGPVYVTRGPVAMGRAVTFPWVAMFTSPGSSEVCLEGRLTWNVGEPVAARAEPVELPEPVPWPGEMKPTGRPCGPCEYDPGCTCCE